MGVFAQMFSRKRGDFIPQGRRSSGMGMNTIFAARPIARLLEGNARSPVVRCPSFNGVYCLIQLPLRFFQSPVVQPPEIRPIPVALDCVSDLRAVLKTYNGVQGACNFVSKSDADGWPFRKVNVVSRSHSELLCKSLKISPAREVESKGHLRLSLENAPTSIGKRSLKIMQDCCDAFELMYIGQRKNRISFSPKGHVSKPRSGESSADPNGSSYGRPGIPIHYAVPAQPPALADAIQHAHPLISLSQEAILP